MDIYHVRNNIKSLRKKKGITQRELAFRLFMDERTYAKIERGEKKSMDIRHLAAIADILETDVQSLIQPFIPGKETAPDQAPVISEHIAQLQQNQLVIMLEMKGLEEKLNRLLASHSATLELIKTAVV